MKIENFLKIMEEIEYSCLSTQQQEEIIMQISDLNRFIEVYNPEIEVVDWMRRQVNIIREAGEKKGIVLCDTKKLAVSSSFYKNCNCMSSIKQQNGLKELWLVYVCDSLVTESSDIPVFLNRNQLKDVYDKVMCLNFLQSQYYTIK